MYRKHTHTRMYDPVPPPMPWAIESAKQLYLRISKAFPAMVAEFEARWSTWVDKTWFPEFDPTWSPFGCLYTDEGIDLILLGPKIIPLIVYKLATMPDGLPGVYLYNELETDKYYKVDPDDVVNFSCVQRQMNLVVDMNHERNLLVQASIQDWKAHCAQSGGDSDALVHECHGCKEYTKLAALGGGVIAHLMLAYAEDPNGFWFELLHEATHGLGKRTGLLRDIDFEWQYDAWSEWFRAGEHDQAPRWSDGIQDADVAGGPALATGAEQEMA